MASIVTRGNGSREVRFYGTDGKRKTLRVGKINKKATAAIASKVEHLVASKMAGSTPDPEVTRWVAGLDATIHARLVALGIATEREHRAVPTLGAWIKSYLDDHAVKASTKSALEKGRDNLLAFFDSDRPLDSITVHDCKRWESWLRTKGNRRDKDRDGLAEGTVRRRVSHAKQFFKAAMDAEHIIKNPFEGLRSTPRGNPDRQFFVPASWITACMDHAPDKDWVTILALCRFGGMRCPSEVLTLRWQDVSLPEGWMRIKASKTEHHADGGVRRCPIFIELRPYLEAAWDAAPDDGTAEYVVQSYRGQGKNLRTRFESIIELAGLTQWPKLFQNLRASRETELLAEYPAKDVVAWLGNSVAVAMEHYAMETDEAFQRAMREGATRTKAHQNAHQSDAVSGILGDSSSETVHEKTAETIVNDGASGFVSVGDNDQRWAIQNSNL